MRFLAACTIAVTASLMQSVTAANSKAIDIFKRAQNARPIVERASPDEFVVNGSAIPDVDFDVGESYAGLLPISDAHNETRELFFWFFPSDNPAAHHEIGLWFNGGPGCSSLSGLLTENGPFQWQAGTLAPVRNTYSWTNLTNMVWIEQPVGVGYTQGVPDITDEIGLAKELIGFYKNFVDTFGLQHWDVYLTGESYAGYYVPYIADAMIEANDKKYYNLKGIATNDPIIGDGTNQQETVIAAYASYWQNVLYLNDTFMAAINAKADSCGYTAYLEEYLTFPPPGPLPVLPSPFNPPYTCDIFDDVYYAAIDVNPCFDIYHISQTCPFPWSVLGAVNPGDYVPSGEEVYFNRSDVQKAINAPVGTNWMQCTSIDVFGGATDNQSLSDNSPGPATDGVLQRVIEYTNNTIIGSGNLDMLLSTNGTLLAIQNMTWNGKQGLQEYPGTPFYVPYHYEPSEASLGGSGYVGYYGVDRGLTFYQVQLSGHELPEYAPAAGYRMLEYLLGRIPSLSDTSDFTTQKGNFTGSMPIS